MSGINLERLIYDPSDANSPNVGAYLRDALGNHLTSTLIGSNQALDVNVITGSDDGIFDEDSAASNGDKGSSVLKVRQDTLTSLVSADGDYEWFKGNSRGALWTAPVGTVDDGTADTEYPVKIGSKAVSSLTALTNGQRANVISDLYRRVMINNSMNLSVKASAVNVTNVATVLPASALAGRKYIQIQNNSSATVYIGDSAVTTASGQLLNKGATMSVEVGTAAMYAIAASAGPFELRVLEFA